MLLLCWAARELTGSGEALPGTGDGGFVVYEINQLSLRQAIAPPRLLGRVNASINFASQGAMLLGSLAGGVLGGAIGVRATLVVGACGGLAAAVWLALSSIASVSTDRALPREMSA